MKNVILITIDSLRADHLSCYGYEKKTTPFMDSLNGLRFTNAFSNAPGTICSFISILAANYAAKNKDASFLSKNMLLISEVLKDNGYRTAAIHSNPFVSRHYGYNKGFDFFEDYLTFKKYRTTRRNIKDKIAKMLEGKKIYDLIIRIYSHLTVNKSIPWTLGEKQTSDAIDWIKKNKDKKFFLWLHYMDVHAPFLPDKRHRKKFSNISRSRMHELNYKLDKTRIDKPLTKYEVKDLIKLYDAEINYLDDQIKKLVCFLREIKIYKNTLLIITSDHGEEFYEYGDFGHCSKLYDINLRVPLIFLNVNKKTNTHKLVSLIDVSPTILALLGIEPPDDWEGRSIFKRKGEIIYFETIDKKNHLIGARLKNYKLILSNFQEEFYELKRNELEKDNLIKNKNYQEHIKYLKAKLLNKFKETEEDKIKTIIKDVINKNRLF